MEFKQSTLSFPEAEILVRSLKPIDVEQLGSNAWKEQRLWLEQLNMCSHGNATQQKDDFVKTLLIDHEKLVVVLHELLTMEAWRQHVYPSVRSEIVENPAAAYFFGYYEAILLNFLECILFHEEAVIALGDDVLELLDYCWRQLSEYIADSNNKIVDVTVPAENALENLTRQMELQRTSRAMACISVIWFIIDRLDALSMAVTNNVLLKNDLIIGFSEVMMSQPWLRRGPGKNQKFIGGTFQDVAGDEVLRICTPEAHVWFVMHKLLCDRECRKKYTYTTSKKELLLRIKRFLNDTIVDQIPALADVQRALEELSFLEPPSGTEEKFRSTLIIEQMPRITAAIHRKDRNWKSIAEQMKKMLLDPRSKMEDAQRMSQIFDQMFAESS